MQDSHRQISLAIVGAFTLVQLLIVLVGGYTPYPDSNAYIEVAREAISLGGAYPTAQQFQQHAFLWNLGAIQLVQWSLLLFQSVTPLLVVYALMKGLTAWFFYRIAHSLTSGRTAFIALLIYVLYPANYGESTSLLSELPFMCLTLGGICLFLCHRRPFLAAFLLAIANWFRPMGIVFLLALIVYEWWNRKSKNNKNNKGRVGASPTRKPHVSPSGKGRATVALIAGYLSAIVLIGGIYFVRTGHFVYQAKTGWMALACYSYDHTDAADFAQNPHTIASDTTLNVAQKDRLWREIFIGWLSAHPDDYAAQMPAKLAKTYISDNVNMCAFLKNKSSRPYLYDEVSLPRLLNDFPHYSLAQWLALLNLLIYYLIVLFALLSLGDYRATTHLLPITIILLGTLLLLFVGHGETRFHIPFMPFFILMAAVMLSKRCSGFGSDSR